MYANDEMMAGTHHIILALGTNTQPTMWMREARALLCRMFPSIRFSREIWTEPIGIDSEPFRNCIAYATTDLDSSRVLLKLKEVESLCGRTAEDRMRNVIKIDVDMLQYDNQRCHEADWSRPYIHQLMREMEDNNL